MTPSNRKLFVLESVDTTAPFDMANASAKWFIYDGANVVLDYVDTDGHGVGNAPTLDKRYFQGPGVDQLLAQENVTQGIPAANRVWWVLPDHLGSTSDLVTGGGIGLTVGTVVAHFQFDSFGQILDGRENVTRYQFTGREHDSNTDLNYHRARWYDPGTGKWLSEDPISFSAGDSNITRYVGNEVLNGTDPEGKATVYGPWKHYSGVQPPSFERTVYSQMRSRAPNGNLYTTYIWLDKTWVVDPDGPISSPPPGEGVSGYVYAEFSSSTSHGGGFGGSVEWGKLGFVPAYTYTTSTGYARGIGTNFSAPAVPCVQYRVSLVVQVYDLMWYQNYRSGRRYEHYSWIRGIRAHGYTRGYYFWIEQRTVNNMK